MFSAAKIAAPSAGGYTLSKSLRFRSSASAYLNRTATSGNTQKWTWSGWVKRGILGSASTGRFFGAGVSGSGNTGIVFGFGNSSDDYFYMQQSTWGTSNAFVLQTNPLYRDPSSWYHVIIAVDTTQATDVNRIKLYINGVQVTSFSSTSYPSQNANLLINNNGTAQYISKVPGYSGDTYFDGYLAEINFVDGQQLTPSSFGSFNSATGVWQPAKYTGTYGTNGFYLPFTNTTSTTTLGYDSSGNGNNWTVNNISLTAGSTYDSMNDVPTLTSAAVANYTVLNPLDANSSTSITNGNLTGSTSSGNFNQNIRCSMALPTTGKYYWEVLNTGTGTGGTGTNLNVGVAPLGYSILSASGGYAYYNEGGNINNGSSSTGGFSTFAQNDLLGVAFDAGANTIYFYKNNTLVNSGGTALSGITAPFFPIVGMYTNGNSFSINFGQRPFTYTPPTGYVALNAYNLPTPTILAGNKYMDATLYTGNGGTQTITNAAGFQPDLVWLKARSNAYGHILEDSVRGALQYLASESTSAESTLAGSVTSFNSNGFSVGNQAGSNGSGVSLVGWQWQAGKGTTSSNTNGSITSTVSVNASAGFSVVTFKGTGANATVGHGLGVAPSFIIVKDRTYSYNWYTYHISLGNTNFTALNTTSVYSPDSTVWNNTSPTSSVFSIGTNVNVNANNDNFVAYCWAAIPGFSAFGSYTGNGSTSGPFIYTGFRPKFILWKCSTSAYDWDIYDTSRDPYNSAYHRLIPDSSGAEQTLSPPTANILSNGFNLIYGYSSSNNNGDTYIYAAFAENPFKYALAR